MNPRSRWIPPSSWRPARLEARDPKPGLKPKCSGSCGASIVPTRTRHAVCVRGKALPMSRDWPVNIGSCDSLPDEVEPPPDWRRRLATSWIGTVGFVLYSFEPLPAAVGGGTSMRSWIVVAAGGCLAIAGCATKKDTSQAKSAATRPATVRRSDRSRGRRGTWVELSKTPLSSRVEWRDQRGSS